MNIKIGSSGFYYNDWKEKFYPKDVPKTKWLEYYSERFETVEINNTFYKMPTEKSLKGWKERTPEDFVFTLKANRFFTHQKKLNTDDDFKERVDSFEQIAKQLDQKLAAILWQLPPSLHKATDKLRRVCDLLDPAVNHVFEFRHSSWFDDEVYDTLRDYGFSFCMVSAPNGLPEEAKATGQSAYLRFHGKKKWYDYHYSDSELEEWANKLKKLDKLDELLIYFNNDYHAYAIDNARKMAALLK